MASERLVGGGGAGVGGGRHARVSPTPGRGSKIAYTPCPRSEPPQDLDLPVSARNCLAIPMSSLQTANGPGKGECKLISKAKRGRQVSGVGGQRVYLSGIFGIFGMQLCVAQWALCLLLSHLHLRLAIIEILYRYCFISCSSCTFPSFILAFCLP